MEMCSSQENLNLFLNFISYEKAGEKTGKEQTWILFWNLYQNSLRSLLVPTDLNWAIFNRTGFVLRWQNSDDQS